MRSTSYKNRKRGIVNSNTETQYENELQCVQYQQLSDESEEFQGGGEMQREQEVQTGEVTG